VPDYDVYEATQKAKAFDAYLLACERPGRSLSTGMARDSP
jgi:hypothetical protein